MKIYKSLNKIITIALNTFKEALRNRIVLGFIILGIFLVAISKAIAWVSVGEDQKVIIDIGLSVILFFGVITAAFTGANLIYQEEEKKTIYVILAKPLYRWEFLLGRYTGLIGLLFINTLILGIVFVGYYLLLGGKWNNIILLAMSFIILEFMILTAFSIFISLITSPMLSAIVTFLIFIIGHTLESLKELKKFVDSFWIKVLLDFLYYILPNFENFDIRLNAAHNLPVSTAFVKYGFLYAIVYTTILLACSLCVISQKDY